MNEHNFKFDINYENCLPQIFDNVHYSEKRCKLVSKHFEN